MAYKCHDCEGPVPPGEVWAVDGQPYCGGCAASEFRGESLWRLCLWLQGRPVLAMLLGCLFDPAHDHD